MRLRWIGGLLAAVVLISAIVLVGCERRSDPASHAGSGTKQLWHCGMHPQVIQDHPGDCPICHMALTPINAPTSQPAMTADGAPVQIDPTVVQNMGVRTARVTRGPLIKTVRTVGMLTLPEPGMHEVSLKIGGWIDKLYVDQEGAHVEKGQPLFELYSPEIQVAEQELISASRSLRALAPDASPRVRDEATKLLESAKRKLRLWDVAEQDIEAIARANEPPKDVIFRSPATGHVEDKMIVAGSSVQAGMKLMRIADHTTMWLEAQVYEDQLPRVKLGQRVDATLDAMPGKAFTGVVTFIHPHLDAMSRTLMLRATLPNPDFALKPGMYATVQIVTQPLTDAVLCPREAVIDTGSRQLVFIAEGDGHFSPRKVKTGITGSDDQVQITAGLSAGDLVVTSGQFLLDVESRTIEATQKLGGDITMGSEQPMEAAPINASPMDAMPMTRPSATEPSAEVMTMPTIAPAQRSATLTHIFCPMVKADWLQVGNAVSNPYLGKAMATCGEIRGQVTSLGAGSALNDVVSAYLDIEKGMAADQLDAAAVVRLKGAADKLPASKFAALRESASSLAQAKDLAAARAAYQVVSAQLIAALNSAAR
jgi:RND family efflux transporter MFP subunit